MVLPPPKPIPHFTKKNTIGRGKTRIDLLKLPVPMPNTEINPTVWNRADRATPGQTNRMLEDRLPDTPSPFGYESVPQELPIVDQKKNMPEALRSEMYLKYAIAAMIGIGIWMVV